MARSGVPGGSPPPSGRAQEAASPPQRRCDLPRPHAPPPSRKLGHSPPSPPPPEGTSSDVGFWESETLFVSAQEAGPLTYLTGRQYRAGKGSSQPVQGSRALIAGHGEIRSHRCSSGSPSPQRLLHPPRPPGVLPRGSGHKGWKGLSVIVYASTDLAGPGAVISGLRYRPPRRR